MSQVSTVTRSAGNVTVRVMGAKLTPAVPLGSVPASKTFLEGPVISAELAIINIPSVYVRSNIPYLRNLVT